MGVTIYLPLHIENVTGFSGLKLLAVFAVVVPMSAVGALIVARLRPDARLTRRIILVGLTLLGANALVFSLMTWLPLVVLCASLHGLFSGALDPYRPRRLRPDLPLRAPGAGLRTLRRRSAGVAGAWVRCLRLWPAPPAGSGATAAGIAAMGVLAFIGVPLLMRWRLGSGPAGAGQGDRGPLVTGSRVAPASEKTMMRSPGHGADVGVQAADRLAR